MREQNQPEEPRPEPAVNDQEATETAEDLTTQDPDRAIEAAKDALVEELELSVEDALRQERDDFEERWLRSVAELDNYRKRTRRELQETRRFAVADVMRDLLEVLDNLERALQAFTSEEDETDTDRIQTGVQMVSQQLKDVLAAHGMQKIDAEQAEFDPRLHEAIQQMEVEGVPSGQIAEVIQTGYLLGDLVLRPSRVIVAK